MADDSSPYNRDKLYEEVWSEPVTVVAKRYGVSDVALHKTCKRIQVPMPPRGYWAKVSAGQQPPKQPLLPYEGLKRTRLYYSGPYQKPIKITKADQLAFLGQKERDRVLGICNSIQVKDRLSDPHALIKQDEEVRAQIKPSLRPAVLLESDLRSTRTLRYYAASCARSVSGGASRSRIASRRSITIPRHSISASCLSSMNSIASERAPKAF